MAKKLEKLNSPTAFRISLKKFKEYEKSLVENKKILFEDYGLKADGKERKSLEDNVRFLKMMGLIKEDDKDFIINTEFDDEKIDDFFKEKINNLDYVDYKLLFLYRLIKTFPFFYEILRIYFKIIWIPNQEQDHFNKLNSEGIKKYIQTTKNRYSDGLNFQLKHVRTIIQIVLDFLGFYRDMGNYSLINLEDAYLKRLLIYYKKSDEKVEITQIADFLEKFFPVVEKKIQFQNIVYPLFQLKLPYVIKELLNSNLIFIDDKPKINILNNKKTKFISYIEYQKDI